MMEIYLVEPIVGFLPLKLILLKKKYSSNKGQDLK